MALSRTKKEELVAGYAKGLAAAPNAFLLSFQGITVPQETELRRRVRESGGRFEVVKNTLALRAVEGQALQELSSHFEGPTAVAYSPEDPVTLAKVLTDFAKDAPTLEFKGGFVDGQAVPAEDCKAIATVPSRDELLAKLFYLLKSPITRLVRCLGAPPQNLVGLLGQISEKKAKGS